MTSLYTVASKTIGWDRQNVPIPSVEEAKALVEKARTDFNAFVELFRVYRHAPSGTTEAEIEAINILYYGMCEVADIWRAKEV